MPQGPISASLDAAITQARRSLPTNKRGRLAVTVGRGGAEASLATRWRDLTATGYVLRRWDGQVEAGARAEVVW